MAKNKCGYTRVVSANAMIRKKPAAAPGNNTPKGNLRSRPLKKLSGRKARTNINGSRFLITILKGRARLPEKQDVFLGGSDYS
jgi:hypothetical protein